MTRSLATRLERLEAKHRSEATKPKGVIGGNYGRLVLDPAKPGHLKWSHPPGGFAEFARKQQADLQADLLRLFADTIDDGQSPAIVDTEPLAPLPKGKKRPRYLEINGREVDTFNIARNYQNGPR